MKYTTLAMYALAAALMAPQVAHAQGGATTLTYVGTIDNARMGSQTYTITLGSKPNSYVMQGKVDLNFDITAALFVKVHVINQSNFTETWENGKLVALKGQTRDRDDNYIYELTRASAPTVTVTKNRDKPEAKQVPDDVAPASFWLEGYFMKAPHSQYISTNSGSVKPAKPPKLESQQTVNFRNQQVKVNYYTMEYGGDKYEYWYLVDGGLLYKRANVEQGYKVVFTLQ